MAELTDTSLVENKVYAKQDAFSNKNQTSLKSTNYLAKISLGRTLCYTKIVISFSDKLGGLYDLLAFVTCDLRCAYNLTKNCPKFLFNVYFSFQSVWACIVCCLIYMK